MPVLKKVVRCDHAGQSKAGPGLTSCTARPSLLGCLYADERFGKAAVPILETLQVLCSCSPAAGDLTTFYSSPGLDVFLGACSCGLLLDEAGAGWQEGTKPGPLFHFTVVMARVQQGIS